MTFQDERIIVDTEKEEKSPVCCLQGLEVTWLQREKDTMEAAENTAEENMDEGLDFFLLSLTIHHWPSPFNKSLCFPD